jgi:hypothetical protein
MANDHRACWVKCPFFYRFDKRNAIVCEGIMPRAEIKIVFDREEDLLRWAEAHCNSESEYKKCLLAQALNGKY